MYLAFKAGREETDPSTVWYEQELDFFDNTVIPLIKRMKDSELFGDFCDEHLTFAQNNRAQWVSSGRATVLSMMERFKEIEFEVEDTFDPIPDGKVFSPSNGR